jgi:hypothetical protein
MKDFTEEQYSESRPDVDICDGINFCLKQLFKDKEHGRDDEIVDSLTFEELIGVLLKAKDIVDKLYFEEEEEGEEEEAEEEE